MNIRAKLMALMCLAILILLGALLLFRHSQNTTLRLIAQNEEQSRLLLVDRIVSMKSQTLKNMANDYTFWDDMVAFIASPSGEWAKQNIDTALDTFHIDLAWVYRPDSSLVYAAARESGRRIEKLPLPLASLDALFAAEHFPHFYVPTDGGMLEVYGASVHPTRDSNRQTPAAGYLFVARWLDAAYLAELSELTQATARVIPAGAGGQPPASHLDDDGIEVVEPLLAFDGKEAAWLSVTAPVRYINELRTSSWVVFLTLAAGVLATLVLITIALSRWVNRPLLALCRSLESGSTAPLEKLLAARNEFGQMAQLVARFFEQKEHLAREITEQAQAKKALQSSEARFNQIFDNAPIGLLALDERLRITHLNIAIQKMFGHLRGDLQREHFSLLVHPEDLAHCQQVYQEMRDGQRIFNRADVRYIGKHGEIVLGRQTDVAIRSPEGGFLFTVSMIEELGGCLR